MKPAIHPGLSIPNPCSMKWKDLDHIDETHRGCNTCNRVIVDFSKMTDAEIVQLLSENKKVCGQFTKQQLNRPFVGEQKPYGFFRLKTLFMLPFLLFGAALSAKNKNVEMNIQGTEQNDQTEKKQISDAIIESHILSGTVFDEGRQYPIALANVSVINGKDTLHTQTDTAGRFTFRLSELQYGDSVSVIVNAPGYLSLTKMAAIGSGHVYIELQMEEIMMLGEVIEYIPEPTRHHKGH